MSGRSTGDGEGEKIGVLGGGAVGGRLGGLLREAGHDLMVGSRSAGPTMEPMEAAARHGDLVVLALPFTALDEVLPPLRGTLRGKIVIDATNPVNADWGPLLLGEEDSAGEAVARLLPDARVVKAFNTVFADVMRADRLDRGGRPATLFIASDDAAAAETVAALGRAVGFAPLVAGPLRLARYLEAMAHLNIAIAMGGGGTNAAFLYDQAAP